MSVQGEWHRVVFTSMTAHLYRNTWVEVDFILIIHLKSRLDTDIIMQWLGLVMDNRFYHSYCQYYCKPLFPIKFIRRDNSLGEWAFILYCWHTVSFEISVLFDDDHRPVCICCMFIDGYCKRNHRCSLWFQLEALQAANHPGTDLKHWHQWPLLLTWLNFNPSMDK